jgi:hypothetical protein
MAWRAPSPPWPHKLTGDGIYRFLKLLAYHVRNMRAGCWETSTPQRMYDGVSGIRDSIVVVEMTALILWAIS